MFEISYPTLVRARRVFLNRQLTLHQRKGTCFINRLNSALTPIKYPYQRSLVLLNPP